MPHTGLVIQIGTACMLARRLVLVPGGAEVVAVDSASTKEVIIVMVIVYNVSIVSVSGAGGAVRPAMLVIIAIDITIAGGCTHALIMVGVASWVRVAICDEAVGVIHVSRIKVVATGVKVIAEVAGLATVLGDGRSRVPVPTIAVTATGGRKRQGRSAAVVSWESYGVEGRGVMESAETRRRLCLQEAITQLCKGQQAQVVTTR